MKMKNPACEAVRREAEKTNAFEDQKAFAFAMSHQADPIRNPPTAARAVPGVSAEPAGGGQPDIF